MTTTTGPSDSQVRVEHADVVVIGSGIGGLVTASLLARLEGLKVVVLERHFKLGGFNHAFTRKGYHWDIGIHYIGGMAPGRRNRRLMDLATGGAVDWHRLPDEFDVFHYPDLTMRVPSTPPEYLARLVEAFPHEREALEGYRDDLKAASGWYTREFATQVLPGPARRAAWHLNRRGRDLALMTAREYLEGRFHDPLLRAVLTSQWGDYAVPPGRVSFAMHALLVLHYDWGAYYPVGGSDTMTDAFIAQVEASGGWARPDHEVTEVIVEDGRAVGVRAHVKKGRGGYDAEFRAPVVVSDAGARLTAQRLLPPGTAPKLEAAVADAEAGVAFATLYAGLRTSPEPLGFHGENHWFFDDPDHDASLSDHTERLLGGYAKAGFLSFPSLRDPEAKQHTAEVVTFVEEEAFAAWRDTEWMRRGEDYLKVKDTIGHALIDLVERRYPGFGDLVDYWEVSTPVTVTSFAAYPSGGYGEVATTPERLRRRLAPTRTEVPGLLLTGSDTCTLGIMGAFMGGMFAAATVMGPKGMPRIMRAAGDAD
jgi:phytoene dehydrogenase-like protein